MIFSVSVPHLKGGQFFGLVTRLISSMKSRDTKILDYVGFIINYFRKRKGEGGGGGVEKD